MIPKLSEIRPFGLGRPFFFDSGILKRDTDHLTLTESNLYKSVFQYISTISRKQTFWLDSVIPKLSEIRPSGLGRPLFDPGTGDSKREN